MKYELLEEQVFLVEKKLSDLGLAYLPLKEEFLDHVCCLVENEIAKGQNFEQSIQVVFEAGSLFFLKKEKAMVSIQPPSPKEFFESNIQTESICNHHFFEEKITFPDPPSINPLKGENNVSSNFGMRFHPVFKKKKFHRGIDFKAPTGTPVLATSNGEVAEVKIHKKGYGKHIVIKHDDHFKTLYAHLNEIKVSKGQIVKIGEVIGTVGSTGFSTVPHLHYEVIKNGKAVDPIAYCNP